MALVSPPTNVFAVFQISPDGSLRLMSGELGPAGASGLGSGTVCVISSTGGLSGPPSSVIAAVNQIGFPPPFSQRYVVDLGTGKVNTF